MGLRYDQKVLLAAAEISREGKGDRGYEITIEGEVLYLTRWFRSGGRKLTCKLSVQGEKIIGDRGYVSELESQVKRLFG